MKRRSRVWTSPTAKDLAMADVAAVHETNSDGVPVTLHPVTGVYFCGRRFGLASAFIHDSVDTGGAPPNKSAAQFFRSALTRDSPTSPRKKNAAESVLLANRFSMKLMDSDHSGVCRHFTHGFRCLSCVALNSAGSASSRPIKRMDDEARSSELWRRIIVDKAEAPLGAMVTLSKLLGASEAILSTVVSADLLVKLRNLITMRGAQNRFMAVFASMCFVEGRAIRANQEAVMVRRNKTNQQLPKVRTPHCTAFTPSSLSANAVAAP